MVSLQTQIAGLLLCRDRACDQCELTKVLFFCSRRRRRRQKLAANQV